MERISISVAEGISFFHVIGDPTMFFDLESLVRFHPECKQLAVEQGIWLNMELHRQLEVLGKD